LTSIVSNINQPTSTVNNKKKQPPISSVCTSRPSATVGPPTDEVVYETEETSIVDVPVEDNYYPFVQVSDYSPSSQFDLDDFNLDYLDNNTNVNPQKAFQDAFENPSETGSSISVSNSAHVTVNEAEEQVWNIPQFNMEEKTAPKITFGLAKAVNAALLIQSDKDAISKIGKQYLRPENVNFVWLLNVMLLSIIPIRKILLCKRYRNF